MKKIQKGASVSFDTSEELALAMAEIRDILDWLNPAHPSTREQIQLVIEQYGLRIAKAWQEEYADKTLEMAKEGTGNMLNALLAGTQLPKPLHLIVWGESDNRTYYIVDGAKTNGQALDMVKAWYKENYIGDWIEDTLRIEPLEIKPGVTRL